jgi:hypothetical protein
MTELITGYHFLREDMRSGQGSTHRKPWVVGQTRKMRGAIIPCRNGYHASPTAFDALQYSPGPVLCLVELSGDVTPHGNPVDKYAGRSRKPLKAVDISRELRLFACECAERVLPSYEAAYPSDLRPRVAIETVRRFADGSATAQELTAAWDAAWAAARDAAWAAARDAESAWQRERFNAICQEALR